MFTSIIDSKDNTNAIVYSTCTLILVTTYIQLVSVLALKRYKWNFYLGLISLGLAVLNFALLFNYQQEFLLSESKETSQSSSVQKSDVNKQTWMYSLDSFTLLVTTAIALIFSERPNAY